MKNTILANALVTDTISRSSRVFFPGTKQLPTFAILVVVLVQEHVFCQVSVQILVETYFPVNPPSHPFSVVVVCFLLPIRFILDRAHLLDILGTFLKTVYADASTFDKSYFISTIFDGRD